VRCSLRHLAILFFAGNLTATTLFAQPPPIDPAIQSLRSDMDELIKGQIELQKQLQELKVFLQGSQACPQTPPPNIVFDTAGAPAEGVANAPVTIIEFSDFQCPFSGRYTNETFPRIDQDYIKTGKVRYVFRDFPLENMHPLAHKLAEAARCAFEQKKFWEMRTQFFANQSALTSNEAMAGQAKALGLNLGEFQKCLGDGRHSQKVSQELTEASAVGVTGTPTFFLGRTDPTGSKVKVRRIVVGHQPYDNFKQAIDALLKEDQANIRKL
jgi:protein-disulfide isomerase